MMKENLISALGKMTYGIYVLTSAHDREINGMIASWVSQVSYDPLLVLVGVHPNRYSHRLISQSGAFALHGVAKDNASLLKTFKGPDPAAKFAGLPWKPGKTGSPILTDCVAFVECEVRARYEPGNHTLFIGEVIDGDLVSDATPLTTADYAGQYLGKD